MSDRWADIISGKEKNPQNYEFDFYLHLVVNTDRIILLDIFALFNSK